VWVNSFFEKEKKKKKDKKKVAVQSILFSVRKALH